MHQCTRFAEQSVGFGTTRTCLRAITESAQLKKAQCTMNSGGPMASGACVD